MKEAVDLLKSPENARRIASALRGSREGDRVFASIDELRAELGLGHLARRPSPPRRSRRPG